ncbi:hypothetical protein ES708_11504 [subsurface metagenome]
MRRMQRGMSGAAWRLARSLLQLLVVWEEVGDGRRLLREPIHRASQVM